ncbi:MAG: hypothetical protein QM761_05010 [Pseudoxanthomonas sp.]
MRTRNAGDRDAGPLLRIANAGSNGIDPGPSPPDTKNPARWPGFLSRLRFGQWWAVQGSNL